MSNWRSIGEVAKTLTVPGSWVAAAPAIIPGYWLVRVRLGRRQYGPMTPAAIIRLHTRTEPGEADNPMDRSPFYAAFLAGEPIDIWSIQFSAHTAGKHIIRTEREITRREYDRMMAEIAEARRQNRYLPMAVPFQAPSIRDMEIPFT